jgi:hypothetical protein
MIDHSETKRKCPRCKKPRRVRGSALPRWYKIDGEMVCGFCVGCPATDAILADPNHPEHDAADVRRYAASRKRKMKNAA